MKRISKFFLVLFIFIIGLLVIKVDAATMYSGKLYEVWHPDSGFTVFAEESSGRMDYNSWMIKSTVDNKVYYCIDPTTPLDGATTGDHTYWYSLSEMIAHSNLTEAKYRKVNLLAYYGYGYKDGKIDHTDKKWYGITQVMIWRVMRPNLTWTFKKDRNSNPDKNLYKEEVEEINNLVANHNVLPSFYSANNEPLKVLLGESKTFVDTNHVLHKYVKYSNNSTYDSKIEGDNLIITGKAVTKSAFSSFKLSSRTSDTYALFSSDVYQNVIVLGEPVDNTFRILVEVTGGILELQKGDYTTSKFKALGEATLEGAVYDVFDSNQKLVGKITTDSDGKGKISLDYGTYKIKEVVPPSGYKLNDKEYMVDISENNNHVNVETFDKVITGKLKLVKTKGGAGEEFVPEEGAIFQIIDKDGEVIEEIKTNNKGMAIKELPYGSYMIHQIFGEEGYVFSLDKKIEMYEDKIYEVDLKDIKLSKLEFTKLDYSTGKPIPDTLIEIYKILDDGSEQLVYSDKTNQDGKVILPNLEIGKYYILEKEAPLIYKINTEKQYFEVLEDGSVIKSVMKDYRKEGKLIFTKVSAIGNKKLKGALIDIFFTENNKKIYSGKTDKDGQIVLDKMPIGKYYLLEEKAPFGYKKYTGKTFFEITKENEVVNVIMKNEKLDRVLIPNTLKNKNYLVVIFGILFIFVGLGYAIYHVKKN